MGAESAQADADIEVGGLSTGEAVIKLLERYGISHVFGIPGVHTMELYRGMAGSKMTHVLCKHEQGLGFAADGYARAGGKPAAVFVITGPGVTNVMTAAGQAHSDSVPMLIIASTNPVGDLGRRRGRLHETRDQRAMVEPVVAFSATAYESEDVPEYIARAFAVFTSQRPRPVFIDIPIDILTSPARGRWKVRTLSARPGADTGSISKAARLLANARLPMIICGGGARPAARQVRLLAEHLGAAVFTTIAGKGIMDGDHPLCLNSTLHNDTARAQLAKADVVLAVGTELPESEFLQNDPLPVTGEMIRIDIDPEQLCDLQKNTLPILADSLLAMQALWDKLSVVPARDRDVAHTQVAGMRDRIVESSGRDPAIYRKALYLVKQALPADALIFTDMTTIAYEGNFSYKTPSAGRWIHPAGYGALGYALPAAIGAKIACLEKTVVAIAGDGGFQFTSQELTVLAERNLGVILLLWDNGCYQQIKIGMDRRDIVPEGVDYASPDFVKLADAHGIRAFKPDDASGFSESLAAAVSDELPTMIIVGPEIFCKETGQ